MSGQAGRAAVVGASGFLGSAVVRALESRGVPTEQFTRERSFLEPGGAVTRADTIFWLASSIRPATASESAGGATADHDAVRSLLDLLEATPDRGRCRVVVVSSGGTVYDSSHRPPHDEATPTVAANAYGQAMLELESVVRERAPEHTVLRVANAYGPGQLPRRGQGVLAHWFDRIARGEEITVMGEDELARDYVYVDDVAAALVLVHEADVAPGVLNIGSGRGTGLGALVEAVTTTVAPAPVVVRREPSRGFDAPSTWLAVDRAAQALGWRPTVDLAEGLARTWAARPGATTG